MNAAAVNRSSLDKRPWPVPAGSWFMRMKWHDLLFMHWPVDINELRPHIPAGLEIDTFEGQAWIGIVPFHMSGVSPRWLPNLPWMSRFPELNVRTYVTIGGKPGVWFFSLDATNPIAVRGARWLFHLNYLDAKIKLQNFNRSNTGDWLRYKSERTHAGEPTAVLKLDYRPIGSAYETQPETLTHFLTSRYCLYSASPTGKVYRGEIDHEPWQLRDAQAIVNCNGMTDGLGIRLPAQPPLLHFAKSTSVVAWALVEV